MRIVHRLAVGHADITGDDFGGIFASAISGVHRGKPLGIADVEWNGCAWSIKTVQAKKPFEQTSIRVISGRNSPSYSSDIPNPFADIQATGRAVLEIWNARVDEALHSHDDLRILVIIRNMDTLEFTLFEHEGARFIPRNIHGRSIKKRTSRLTMPEVSIASHGSPTDRSSLSCTAYPHRHTDSGFSSDRLWCLKSWC
jgi:hypothetical protein